MPSQSKVTLRPFVQGLNTEINGTIDSTVNTADELNCTIFNDGTRGRRYGLNIEKFGEYFSTAKGKAYSGYLWKNVNKTDLDIIVYQVDTTLHFYKYLNKPYSINKYDTALDISKAVLDISNFLTSSLSYAIADGKLIIVNKYFKPIVVTFNIETQTFSYEELTIYYRDFEGLEDGLRVDEMPVDLSNEHHYNLVNQGWQENEINKVKQDNNKYPANNMQWFLGKDESGSFQTTNLLAVYFGNTRAPKGHCILNYFDRDRTAASGIYSSDGRRETSYSYHNRYPSGSWAWVYETKINKVEMAIPNSSGTANSFSVKFFSCNNYNDTPQESATCELYGLNGSNTWQFIDRMVFGFKNEGNSTKAVTNDTKYNQYKVVINLSSSVSEVNCWCAVNMKGSTSLFPYTGPSSRVIDIASMSGKLFYLAGDTVLFSQTINEDANNIGKCYQEADPTSEEISDIIDTDGGHVKFQAMGEGLALTTFNRGVLVFGREKVYGLLSPRDKKFSATEYDTIELSSAGLAGNKSVVSVSDSVYYWSPLGIFRIGVNYNTGTTLVAENISSTTIQQYYNNISQYSKTNAKGVFDFATNRIYWYYPLTDAEPWRLNGVLVYDLNYNAFMPYRISDGGAVVGVFTTIVAERIRPSYSLYAGDAIVKAGEDFVIARQVEGKYDRFQALQHCIIDDNGAISFGDYNSRDFKDWLISSYDSYMLSVPLTFDDTYFNKQAPILQTILRRTEEDNTIIKKKYIGSSGAYLRMRWGWSIDDKSNRWDLIQSCYIPPKDFLYTDYVVSQIHIRGRGRALQIEIRNDKDKDFRLAAINMLIRV